MMRCPHAARAAAQATPDESLMRTLRVETRAHHQRVEQWPQHALLCAGALPHARLLAQLHAYLIVHEGLEHACSHSASEAVRQAAALTTPRASLLRADLRALDPHAAHRSARAEAVAWRMTAQMAALAEREDAALLGWLYVFEGSALGNLVIRRHLIDDYGLAPEHLRFFEGCGQETAARWRRFGAQVDRSGAEAARVVAGACEAFEHMSALLEALSEGLDDLLATARVA